MAYTFIMSAPEQCYLERVKFEKAFLGGNEQILSKFYDALAQADLGREIIVICQNAEPS